MVMMVYDGWYFWCSSTMPVTRSSGLDWRAPRRKIAAEEAEAEAGRTTKAFLSHQSLPWKTVCTVMIKDCHVHYPQFSLDLTNTTKEAAYM
jgi:hypothetical protein